MSNSSQPSFRERVARFFACRAAIGCVWRCILEFALFLWVARAPFGVVIVGYLLLGAAPQAQDLLIPLVDSSWYFVLFFFVLHFLFWAMPVHYQHASSFAMMRVSTSTDAKTRLLIFIGSNDRFRGCSAP